MPFAEPASDFFQGDIGTGFGKGLIQLGCGLGIDDSLLTEFGKKGNGHLYVAVWKGIHQRLKAVAVGGHISIVASRAIHFIELGNARMQPTVRHKVDQTPATPDASALIRITRHMATSDDQCGQRDASESRAGCGEDLTSQAELSGRGPTPPSSSSVDTLHKIIVECLHNAR